MSEAAELFAAVAAGDLQRTRDLVVRAPSLVHARNIEGATPVHIAAFNGRRDVVEFLVEQGADVNARNQRAT